MNVTGPSMKWFIFSSLLVFGAVRMPAQSLVPPDRVALLAGTVTDEAGFIALAGYPTPERLSALKDQLGLTREQQKKIDGVLKDRPITMKVKGEEIVEAEEDLLKALQSGTTNEKQVRAKVERVGKLRADLRFIQFQIALKLRQILTPNQSERYKELAAPSAH